MMAQNEDVNVIVIRDLARSTEANHLTMNTRHLGDSSELIRFTSIKDEVVVVLIRPR